jgi:SP family sugar:H+ symporter-like MFS transporter
MVDPDKGNLGAKVFFVWGSLCCGCFIYAYFLVYETKGLTLEQVDMMMTNSSPRTSAKWLPTTTFAEQDAGLPLEERDKSDMVVSDKAMSTA